MADSFSKQLEDLLNPLPKFEDPEDDHDEATKAKIVEKLHEDGDEDEVALSGLRKKNTSALSDTDGRYLGKAVSRKQLLMDNEGSGEDDDDEDDDDDDEEDDNALEGGEDEDKEVVSGDEDDDWDENDVADLKAAVSKIKVTDVTFPQKVDFHKLTEGMDDLGESEEDDDDDESGEEDESSEEESGESDEEDGSEDEDDMEDDGTVRTFSKEKVDEEVERGKAVKDQLALWDQLLEGRIKIQKAVVTANQLPQPQTFPEFKEKGGAELAGALKNSHKALKALQRSLLELQDQLLFQNPDTRPLSLGKAQGASAAGGDEEVNSDEEEEMQEEEESSRPPKRKLEMAEYPGFMAKRFAAFQPYRNATLQKWHDKTRLTTGKSSKGFGSFDRNILTQVEQVLMDKDRLLRRTQTRRSEFRVLGKPEASAPTTETSVAEGAEAAEPQQAKANAHLKDLDEDIFDDDDFYHQLLRELIDRKTSAADPNDQVAMGKQWLAIQKLRSKIKKKVDTKASKGRKLRFHVHGKLVNFMAPMDRSVMNDEARNELYRSLFGKNSTEPRE